MTDIPLNRGSDLSFAGVWRDATGAAVNMTGWQIAVYDPQHFPDGVLPVVAWTNAALGQYAASLQWSDAMQTGRLMNFRLRATRDGVDLSSPQIWIAVK